MIPSTCPACGGDLAPWRTVPAAEPGMVACVLQRCGTCATAVTDGPAAVADSGAYAPGSPRLARIAAPVLARFDRRRLDLARRAVAPPARLLDAGAGRGRFVAAARAAGYTAEGIEPSTRAERDVHLVRLRRASIENAAVEPGSLDVVTLWHVLEHVDEPAAALQRIAGWLRPGGALLVGVPNLASLQARLGGAHWFHLEVPRHRTHFTVRGIVLALQRAGFEVESVHHVLGEHNPFGMWQSLVNRVTKRPSYLFHLLQRNAPFDARDLALTLLALPLVPVAAALELAAGLAGHGGTVAVIARRPRPPQPANARAAAATSPSVRRSAPGTSPASTSAAVTM